jgi:hypothetical protein
MDYGPNNLETPNTKYRIYWCLMICKATRIQNDSKTLIDHILSNSRELGICAGTIPIDISDHFFTFAMTSFSPVPKQTHRIISSRDFSYNNLLGSRENWA